MQTVQEHAELVDQTASVQRGETPPGNSERAIGVVFRPETACLSSVLLGDLPAPVDAVVQLDRTLTHTLLKSDAVWDCGKPPETLPPRV